MLDALQLYQPRYRHLVWNRTDLTIDQPNQVTGVSGNLSVTYGAAQPPLVAERFPPSGYAGEIIPPYAALRVLTNPIWYEWEGRRTLCWLVCRPDDSSMAHQQAGLHFFNGPAPIPVGGYGLATQDFPAPVLVDITVDSPQLPYGNVTSTGAEWLGVFIGFVSGDWALHPAGDLINYGANTWLAVDTGLTGGKATMMATKFPYCILGQHPAMPSGKTPRSTDSPTLAFTYSSQLFWVGEGAIGFGSTGISG